MHVRQLSTPASPQSPVVMPSPAQKQSPEGPHFVSPQRLSLLPSRADRDRGLMTNACHLTVNLSTSHLQCSPHADSRAGMGFREWETSSPDHRNSCKSVDYFESMSNQSLHSEKIEHKMSQSYRQAQSKGDTPGMTMSGQKVVVITDEYRVDKMVASRKEDGQNVREAEKQIRECVTKLREPPPKKSFKTTTAHYGIPQFSKEVVAFRRVFESMPLSTLRVVDRIDQMNKMNSTWRQKVALVSQMKNDRERKRQKIEDFHNKTLGAAESWKNREEDRLAKLRKENAKKASEEILRYRNQYDTANETQKRLKEDYSFSMEFANQGVGMGREVLKNDGEMVADKRNKEVKEQTQSFLKTTRWKREEGKMKKKICETQLIWDGALARKERDGKIAKVL